MLWLQAGIIKEVDHGALARAVLEQLLGVGTVVGMFAKMCEDIAQVPSNQIFRIFFLTVCMCLCVHVCFILNANT